MQAIKANLPIEAATRGLLEVSLCRWLGKTLTDSSSGPSEECCMGAAAKASLNTVNTSF